MNDNEKTRIKLLIVKMMDNSITPSEYEELLLLVKKAPPQEVESTFTSIWNDYEPKLSVSSSKKKEIFEEITSKTVQKGRNIPKRLPLLVKLRKVYSRAAAILLPLLAVGASLYLLQNDDLPNTFTTKADWGEKSYILLPDSSEVWLNSGSELSYNTDFNENRTITLKGEGYFNIKNRNNSLFFVNLETTKIVVEGTTFNVSAYDADSMVEISLVDGKIAIEDRFTSQIIKRILPNQQFTYFKNNPNDWTIANCDALTCGIWHNGILQFTNASPTEVYNKLERWYGVKISVEKPNNKLLYGFTTKSESLREMLDLINRITPITYQINGEEVRIQYK